MEINEIAKLLQKPTLYDKGTQMMWTDPHIQKYLLDAHLSQNTEAASRKEENIIRTISWMFQNTINEPLFILDLGCGPGLYTEKMAELGNKVIGMDFSTNSIEYAKKSARSKKIHIDYVVGNYLVDAFRKQLDLITLIYCDFGVLSMEEQDFLLRKIYSALKPKGTFIFDAFNMKLCNQLKPKKDFTCENSGFWRDHPYICLSETFLYPEENAFLDQHVVIDEKVEVYRFYNHYFSSEKMIHRLEAIGFKKVTAFKDIISDETVTFYRCTK